MPDTMPDGGAWPKISIVTPSYQQGQFIEETIRSVLLQGYPNLEYIVIDGGSTDQSVSVIRKYEPWLTHWVSEKDQGQSDAINKGFAKATGEILAWLNSDDFYRMSALAEAATELSNGCGMVIGEIAHVDSHSRVFIKRAKTRLPPGSRGSCLLKNGLVKDFMHPQPAMFWTREVHMKAQPLAKDLHYVMDLDFVLRAMAQGVKPRVCESFWSCFRWHETSKSSSQSAQFNLDAARMYWRLSRRPDFRRWACLCEARRNLGYYCRKRMIFSLGQKQYLRGLLWLGGGVLVYPSWAMTRDHLGAIRRHGWDGNSTAGMPESDRSAPG
jgi:glycosyltransferase involved in cell wall biosynthesis